jgi:hypothetical protein
MRTILQMPSWFARLLAASAAMCFGLGALTAVPVLAVGPTFERNIAVDDTSFLPNTSRQCGFDVYLRQVGTFTFKVLERATGVVTFQELAGHSEGTYSAPSTGRSLTVNVNDAGTNIETIYPDGRDVSMNAGTDGVITVPGFGHVYIGVGLVRVTVDANGNVGEVSVGARDPDHSGVCPLLA